VDRQVVDFTGLDPLGGLGLGVVLVGFAAEGAGVEADGELLADLAVVVGHDVTGVGVEADYSSNLHVHAGLLSDLTSAIPLPVRQPPPNTATR